jgi:hypothetical protein
MRGVGSGRRPLAFAFGRGVCAVSRCGMGRAVLRCECVAARSLTDAPDRHWGSGWPTDRSADCARAEGRGIRIQVHHEIAPVVSELLKRTVAVGYELRRTSCGGYVNRPMKRKDGTLTPGMPSM